jgi:hypothetical protein
LEDPILSQKLSQLNITSTKKLSIMPKDMQNDLENIPDYLTKRNPSFREMLHQALSTITTLASNQYNNVHMDSLRHIAISIHKIMSIQLNHHLWTTYLKSGMGQLISSSEPKLSYSTAISIWPKQIKSFIKFPTGKETNHGHEFYLKLVQNHLCELEQRLKQFQMELHLKTRKFQGYTVSVEKMIEAYIEQNLRRYRMEIANQIELIHYDCHIRALKLEYLRHQLNAYQVCSFLSILYKSLKHVSNHFRST